MFSILMAAYNAEKYLADSIRSVLAQTIGDFELLIVDDGSTDATLQIAQRFASQDERIRVIARGENGGVAAARNDGLLAACRDWIVIHDADDIMLPERLEIYVRAIAEQPDVIAWGAWAQHMSPEGQRYHRVEMGPTTREAFHAHRAQSKPVYFKDPTFAFRRDAALQIGGYAPVFQRGPDVDIMDRLSDCGVMLTLPVVVTHYRVHPSATSQGTQTRNNLESRFVFYRRREQDAGRPIPTFDMFLDWYNRQPFWTRVQWWLVDLSHGRRYTLPMHLARRAYPRVVFDVVISVLANPVWFIEKVSRVLRTRRA